MRYAVCFFVAGERMALGAVDAPTLMEACELSKVFAREEHRAGSEMSCFGEQVGYLSFPADGGYPMWLVVMPPDCLDHALAGCAYDDDGKAELAQALRDSLAQTVS